MTQKLQIRKFVSDLQSARNQSTGAVVLKWLLLPATLIYGIVLLFRDLCYRSGLMPQKQLPGTVISIGNLTTGGTGKTPLILKLVEQLKEWGAQPAVFTRGYGAAYSHSDLLLQAGHVDRGAMDWLADEVVLLTTKLDDCWIGIGKERYQLGMKLHEQHDALLFLLDDGFAHRQLARDLDILLIDAVNPFGNGHLLPAGNLREAKGALTRADLILLTRCESVAADDLKALENQLRHYIAIEDLFKLRTDLKVVYDFATGTTISAESLRGKRFVAFSGIGNPESFAGLLQVAGLDVAQKIDFGDHYRYTDEDVDRLVASIEKDSSMHLLTTEKDAVKLPSGRFKPNACLVAQIELVFVEREDIFLHKIREVVGC